MIHRTGKNRVHPDHPATRAPEFTVVDVVEARCANVDDCFQSLNPNNRQPLPTPTQ